MTEISKCPKCNGEFVYFDGSLYVCPDCGHEFNVVVLTRNAGFRFNSGFYRRTAFLYRKYPKLRKTLSRRNEMYNAQMELVERLEREGKILVIRPERPLEVGRLCKDTVKMRRLYDEGYEVAKRTFEQFLKG